MAYELVKPEGEEQKKNEEEIDPRDKKGWEPPPWAKVGTESWHKAWMGDADSGYVDSFNSLKKQIDHTRMLYQDQLGTIPRRKEILVKEKNTAWFHVILFMLLLPALMLLLTQLALEFGTEDTLWGIVYLILKVASVPVIIVCVFFALPASARDMVNAQWRYRVLMHPEKYGKYRAQHDVVTFAEEEHFLKHNIGKIDDFYKRVKEEHLDQSAAGEAFVFLDEMSEKQTGILAEMQKLSQFTDYQARVSQLSKKAGAEWILMGFGIFFGLIVLVLVFSGIKMAP